MERIRVMVVDDHPLFRRGVVATLAHYPEIEVVGEASNGEEAVRLAKELSPQVIVIDLNMPVMGGVEAIRQFQSQAVSANVMVLTVSEEEEDLFSAMEAGAKGYLLKNSTPDALHNAVLHIAEGGVLVSPAMASALLTALPAAPAAVSDASTGLSAREHEVLELISQGATNKEIASQLIISENTVKTHLRNIMEKLHVANRSQAAAYAARLHLGRPKPLSGQPPSRSDS